MLDNYTQGNYNSTEANAVATLMYACGIASDMQYAPTAPVPTPRMPATA